MAWLAVRCTASAVSELARVEWHSVGGVCRRVYAELEAARGASRFDRRCAASASTRRRTRRATSTSRWSSTTTASCLIWAHEGTGKDVLNLFLDELTREQRRAIEVVTADGARWIRQLVKRRCPNARWVMDPFHVVQWMNDALDAVRLRGVERRQGRQAQARGQARQACQRRAPPEEVRALEEEAASIKGSRYALVKNPEDLTDGQRARLEALKKRAGSRLVRAWELKEDLRAVFRAADGSEAAELLDDWMHRAAYCKIAKVVAVEKKVRRRRDDIIAAVELGISNGRVEAINNKIKVTVRMGYGFRNTDNLVALLMLRCGDCQPQLPGRPVKARKKGVKGAKSVAEAIPLYTNYRSLVFRLHRRLLDREKCGTWHRIDRVFFGNCAGGAVKCGRVCRVGLRYGGLVRHTLFRGAATVGVRGFRPVPQACSHGRAPSISSGASCLAARSPQAFLSGARCSFSPRRLALWDGGPLRRLPS